MAWLNPTSLVVAVANAAGGPRQLWRLSYPDGKLSRVTNDLNQYEAVGLSADRSTLVTARAESRRGVVTTDAEAKDSNVAVPPGPQILDGVAWARDKVLFVTALNGPPSIMVWFASGGPPQEIIPHATNPDVTPDGLIVVFTSTDDSAIWKADVDGARRTKVTVGDSQVVMPDGRSLLFRSSATGMPLPWFVRLDGGSPRQVSPFVARAGSIAVSPNARELAFISRDEKDNRILRTCPIAACDRPRTVDVPPIIGRLRFTPDGRSIAYLDAAASNIWLVPLAGGSPRQLTHYTDGATIGDFAWSRDGKRLAVSRGTVANDIVLLKGLGQ
jgi:Tol biopolymer transport system component